MRPEPVNHPLFARFYTRFSAAMEKDLGPSRRRLTAGLTGRVLEVGSGNGMNFRHYPDSVAEVVAVEPEPYLRARAVEAAAEAAAPVNVVNGDATALEFGDDSFDTVIFCLVLCSVADPAAALNEARRVLTPDGTVRFLEHVAAPRPAKAKFQRFLDSSGIWPRIAGGCTCGRDTVTTIARSGFRVEELAGVTVGPAWGHTNPHVIGHASVATS
jgi:ubiquinone/menaquinone biosynthesis C-methylase UbiE